MTTPSTTVSFTPAIEILGNLLAQTGASYQQLLAQSASYPFCHEAGRSVRHLSDRYTQVLFAAFGGFTPESDDDYAEWEEEGDAPSEEEPDE